MQIPITRTDPRGRNPAYEDGPHRSTPAISNSEGDPSRKVASARSGNVTVCGLLVRQTGGHLDNRTLWKSEGPRIRSELGADPDARSSGQLR